jgi:hypothetical protein
MRSKAPKLPITVYLSFDDLTAVKDLAKTTGTSDSAWVASQIKCALQLAKAMENPLRLNPEVHIIAIAERWLTQFPTDLRDAVYDRVIQRRQMSSLNLRRGPE